MFSLKTWRRRRLLARSSLPPATWEAVLGRLPMLDGLSAAERDRLRELSILFLHEKVLEPVAPLQLEPEMRLELAAQACLPILYLGPDWYAGWTGIVLYPTGFLAPREEVDEAGVVHASREHLSGESWLRGPVILSWEDVESGFARDGYNLVIHELAHKLDMLNGDANGMPPLHADMDQSAWTAAFTAAYADLEHTLARGEESPVDPYAAESPAEFFAVLSEAFFEIPADLRAAYPAVYRQLRAFYRQDPARRLHPL